MMGEDSVLHLLNLACSRYVRNVHWMILSFAIISWLCACLDLLSSFFRLRHSSWSRSLYGNRTRLSAPFVVYHRCIRFVRNSPDFPRGRMFALSSALTCFCSALTFSQLLKFISLEICMDGGRILYRGEIAKG